MTKTKCGFLNRSQFAESLSPMQLYWLTASLGIPFLRHESQPHICFFRILKKKILTGWGNKKMMEQFNKNIARNN